MVFRKTIYDVDETFEGKRNQVAGECSATWHPSQAVFLLPTLILDMCRSGRSRSQGARERS